VVPSNAEKKHYPRGISTFVPTRRRKSNWGLKYGG